MLLTAAIDVRYLWVDSLCIVQDDENSRRVHLNSMDAIYANAYVKKVAAVGEDVRHGIPGVPNGSHTRNHPCRIIQAEPCSRWLLRKQYNIWPDQTKWYTQGW
jgi:hypothetical protein